MERSYGFTYIYGMSTYYLKVFIIPSENRTSADPCCNWHAKDEVVFVHIDLTNILRQLFWLRVANYSHVFDGLLKLVVRLEKVVAEAPEVFLQILLSLKFEYCIIH